MQQPHSNCLVIELTATPLSSEGYDGSLLELQVTSHFQEVWQPLGRGRFKFGLTGGILQLKLAGAKVVTGSDSTATPEYRLLNTATDTEPSWLVNLPRTLQRDASVTPSGVRHEDSGSGQYKTSPLQIKILHTTEQPATVEISFLLTAADVRMVEAEELWHHDISPNKHAILERKLIKSLVELKLQPHTNQVELPSQKSTGDKNLGATEIFWIEANPEQIKATEALWEVLQEDITKVVGAGTDDLVELAKIVNLNPLNDFAGANLLACDLRNGDFTGADFTKANLRGADLTDADFTGALLVGAKLAGADLTGAMLSDADLTGADLHLSSLALASLSGAKLEGANLHQANLSNANLSDADLTDADLTEADLHQAGLVLTNLSGANLAGAKVAAARFKSAVGITEAIVRDLQQLGAIFEEL